MIIQRMNDVILTTSQYIKQIMRIDHADDDVYLQNLTQTAIEILEQKIGSVIVSTYCEHTVDCTTMTKLNKFVRLVLPEKPAQSIQSIEAITLLDDLGDLGFTSISFPGVDKFRDLSVERETIQDSSNLAITSLESISIFPSKFSKLVQSEEKIIPEKLISSVKILTKYRLSTDCKTLYIPYQPEIKNASIIKIKYFAGLPQMPMCVLTAITSIVMHLYHHQTCDDKLMQNVLPMIQMIQDCLLI